LHIPHVPPPPQAEGKKSFASDKVESKLDPPLAASSFSPLILMVTGPEGASLALATSNMTTRAMVTIRKIKVPATKGPDKVPRNNKVGVIITSTIL
jgi:hypothetical protein